MSSADVWCDGERLSTAPRDPGRKLKVDGRCVHGEALAGCWAHVCASPDPRARIPFDDPAVQQARRDALAWWIPLLGERLVCLSTLAVDAVHFAGANTVVRERRDLAADPFARLFAATLVRVDDLCPVPPPAGLVVERYAGAPWPAGSFRQP